MPREVLGGEGRVRRRVSHPVACGAALRGMLSPLRAQAGPTHLPCRGRGVFPLLFFNRAWCRIHQSDIGGLQSGIWQFSVYSSRVMSLSGKQNCKWREAMSGGSRAEGGREGSEKGSLPSPGLSSCVGQGAQIHHRWVRCGSGRAARLDLRFSSNGKSARTINNLFQ